MKIFVDKDASRDIGQAFEWYEQHQKGLGNDFISSIDAALKHISSSPEAYPVIFQNARRILLRKFPFGVYYTIQDDRLVVVAVFHFRRDIGKIR